MILLLLKDVFSTSHLIPNKANIGFHSPHMNRRAGKVGYMGDPILVDEGNKTFFGVKNSP